MDTNPDKQVTSPRAAGGTVCEVCAAPAPDAYLSSTGATVCRVCYYAEQTRAQDSRAARSLAADVPAGFKLAPAGEETRASNVRIGWIALGLCVGVTVATAVLLNQIYLWSGIIGIFGLRAFARALKLPRLDGRRNNVGIGIGIAATLLVLLAIVAITILGV